jgi:hypothetical protein
MVFNASFVYSFRVSDDGQNVNLQIKKTPSKKRSNSTWCFTVLRISDRTLG